jgi:transcriptional regulator with XRE-family HTH domain
VTFVALQYVSLLASRLIDARVQVDDLNISETEGIDVLSPTLESGLRNYAIGPKVRALRLKKKMGLVELGRHTGLSPAMLSKIERGQLFPTLPTLLRVALVFGLGLDFFFAAAREKPVLGVVRRRDRLRFSDKAGGSNPAYEFESLDYSAVERKLNAYYAEFLPATPDTLRLHQHAGGEFIYALQGTLTVRVGEEDHALEPGDSMYFDSSAPHGYRRTGGRSCNAIVVTTA